MIKVILPFMVYLKWLTNMEAVYDEKDEKNNINNNVNMPDA